MEVTAINHVLTTVKQTRVIFRMDPVLDVNLDGQEEHVTKVWHFVKKNTFTFDFVTNPRLSH